MKATVNVLCYRSKTLSNGEHPLMICVCKDRKRRYISLGVSVKSQFWDFEKSRPKRNCPNREWKSRVRLTPEGEVALTPENEFLLTPKEPWPVGSFLFRLTCLLLSFACSLQ